MFIVSKSLRPLAAIALLSVAFSIPLASASAEGNENQLLIPLNRSVLISTPSAMSQVVVASPDVADVSANDSRHLTIMAKRSGQTNVRIFDRKGAVMRDLEVTVGQDLPAIRKALKNFLPDENIGVEMVNTGIALTGSVSSQAAADKALRVTHDFLMSSGTPQIGKDGKPCCGTGATEVLNFMQIASSQQVMLRVRVGEIQRTALKNLGVDLSAVTQSSAGNVVTFNSGALLFPGLIDSSNTQGAAFGSWSPGGSNDRYSAILRALERDGLFKTLAEPNLVAASGEEAEFLSGGEIPIPVVQGNNANNAVSVMYKPFGVSVKFTPNVLSENRIRIQVNPEVSEVSATNAVRVSGFNIPSIETRRAKTTVELAPGESFMIAGLISDQTRSSINQIPGAKELPILGALFRSSSFQRNETELVIAVTPYVVDPMKSSDVKLPTDNFRPATQLETFFYGALGGLSNHRRSRENSQQGLEGPIGFMVD